MFIDRYYLKSISINCILFFQGNIKISAQHVLDKMFLSLLKRYMNNANRLIRIESVIQVVYFINDFIARPI